MFLTRLGPSAKCIITGDLSQIDLPGHQKSGLQQAMDILEGVSGIAILSLTAEDVVRHRLVKEIIKAYDKLEAEERLKKEQSRRRREPSSESDLPAAPDKDAPQATHEIE
jgi:Phosphate starvation-inducible protein PhoH, predicted ATPase